MADTLDSIKKEFMDYGDNGGEPYIIHFDKERLLKCNYVKSSISLPWDCNICDSDEKNCEHFIPSKEVLTPHPEHLKTSGNTVDAYLDKEISCERDALKRVLSCGKTESQTLKLTQRRALKVIRIPKGVSLFEGTYLNNKLWAKSINFESVFNLQINEALFDEKDKEMFKLENRKLLMNYGGTGLSGLRSVDITWKDDFEDEFNSIITPVWATSLDIHYNKDWFEDKAVREWLANAFDVTENPKDIKIYKDEHGNWVIEYETNRVLELSHLAVLGKHDEGVDPSKTKGQFGEGITLGALIFSRQGYPMKIEAIGRTYYPTILYNDIVKDQLLHFYYTPNEKKIGTKVTIMGLPDEIISNVKSQFLFFREDYKVIYDDPDVGQILEFAGHSDEDNKHIAIRDLLVTDRRMIYSYNIYNKRLQNRDRDLVSMHEVRDEISSMFEYIENKDIIRRILRNYDEEQETPEDLHMFLDPRPKEIWREIIEMELYPGEEIVVAHDPISDANCDNMGYHVLDWGYYGMELLKNLDYETTDNIPGSKGKPVVMDFDELTNDEKTNYKIAREITKNIIRQRYREKKPAEDLGKIKIASTFEGCLEAKGKIIGGMWRKDDETIYVHQKSLANPPTATGVLIHEYVHKRFGYGDECREFESILTDIIGFTGHEWDIARKALFDLKSKSKCKIK